jgi:hypothetical protein
MAEPRYSPAGTLTTEDALYLQIAADTVERLAPLPDDLTSAEEEDYEIRATGAEFLVYTWLSNTTGGSVTSESVSGLSASYAQFTAVQSLVLGAMGDYYTGGVSTAANTGYIQDFA